MVIWVSAFRGPDDVVPLGLSVAEEEDPLVSGDVGGSAPGGVTSKHLHVPSSSEWLLHLLLNVEGVCVDIGAEGLVGLVNVVQGSRFLSICDSASVSLKTGMVVPPIGSTLDHSGLLLQELFHGTIEGRGRCGSEQGQDDGEGDESFHLNIMQICQSGLI